MSGFCGNCGAPTPQPTQFCTACGAPREQAAPPTMDFSAVSTPPTGGPPRGLLIGGAAAAVVVLIGGIVLATSLLSGEDDTPEGTTRGAQRQAVRPVTEQPTETWTWRSDSASPSVSVNADGELVMVSESGDGDGTVTRLSTDGEELWSDTEAQYVSGVDEKNDVVYVATAWEDSGMAALDADTGEEKWHNDDWTFHSVMAGGRALVVDWSDDDAEVIVADSTGNEITRVRAEQYAALGERLLVLDGDTLTLFGDGTEEVWTMDAQVDADYVGLAVTEGLVTVSGWNEVVGVDPSNGAELWRENLSFDEDVSISTAGPGLVTAVLSGDSEEYVEGEVVFLGPDGIRERRALDPDECCYFMSGFAQGGEEYYASNDEGVVYDADLTPTAHFDGELIPASTGFYELHNGELSYHEIDGTERWARQVADDEEYPTVVPLDGKILVSVVDTVTAYE